MPVKILEHKKNVLFIYQNSDRLTFWIRTGNFLFFHFTCINCESDSMHLILNALNVTYPL